MPDTVSEQLVETCGFISVDGRRVHYRQMGSGPAMVMLHASPLSSKSLRPAMQTFAQEFNCIALDTPGFGLSDPLPDKPDDIFSYADALKKTLDKFELEQPILYGASTGAAITHAFGCRYPDTARLLMLDTFSHHDADDTLGGYFPDLSPQRDGRHLLACWEKIEGLFLFAPWQKAEPDRRQIRDLPPLQALHEMAMQQLGADPAYKLTYKAAIEWENKDNVDRLKAPATINVWPSASSISRVRMITENNLPKNFTPIESDPGPLGRYAKQFQYLIANDFHSSSDDLIASDVDDRRLSSHYTTTRLGQVFWKSAGSDRSNPVLLLHDWASSSNAVTPLLDGRKTGALIIAPDLPGHGDSPACWSSQERAFDETVDALVDFIDTEELSNLRLVGFGASAAIAHAIRARRSASVSSLSYVATAPMTVTSDDLSEIKAAPFQMEPAAGGTHLVSAFSLAKRHSTFWPWWRSRADAALARHDPMNVNMLHKRSLDLLKCRGQIADLQHQSSKYMEANGTEDIQCFAPPWRVGGAPLCQHSAIFDNRGATELPSSTSDWIDTLLSTDPGPE